MEFGLNFFPSVGPADRSAEQYWAEALHLVDLCDRLGYTHVRTVEHYFHAYGGYSPNPVVFLAAAAQRSRRARMVTGAVLPVFNNPLKLAGELAMLDAISNGRLDAGFARAFLPHEFETFAISLDESRARFDEGIEQVRRLLEDENVTCEGQFHSFRNVTSLPRPTQKPRPPFWIAAFATPQSFETAGRNGHSVMAIPMSGGRMAELIGIYRDAWRSAGHAGDGRVMLSFSMHVAATAAEAVAAFGDNLDAYLNSLVEAASGWLSGPGSRDYPGYDKMIAALRDDSFAAQRARGLAWVGDCDEVADMMADYLRSVGRIEIASLHITPHLTRLEDAERSMRLFAERVMPRFAEA
jgi:alkanesulfonate monooxygenase SsuD/methylene tetrahydromethanopterin reductase-like flavin-dependent oxidoreductase (luciferase family)